MIALYRQSCYVCRHMVTLTNEQKRKRWGRLIREARLKKGLSQEELAREWGNTLSYLQKVETGTKGNEETYAALIEVLSKIDGRKKAS